MRLSVSIIDKQSALKFIAAVVVIIFWITAIQKVQGQSTDPLGNRFFSSTITLSDKNILQRAIFNDIDGNLIVQGVPLIDVIGRAYGYELQNLQVVNGPDWIYQAQRYDIKAMPPPAMIESNDEQMLRNLLAEKFKLAIHEEVKEMEVLALKLEGDSLNIQWFSNDNGRSIDRRITSSFPGYKDIQYKLTLDALAILLSKELNLMVLNLTGLTGTYVIELERVESIGYEIDFSPLLKLLGLGLVAQNSMVDVLVVTNIDHPELGR